MKQPKNTPSNRVAEVIESRSPAGRNAQQSGLEANAEDLFWAKTKAADQDVSKNDVPQPKGHPTLVFGKHRCLTLRQK